MAVALRGPPASLLRLWQPTLVPVTLGMLGMWLAVTLLVLLLRRLPVLALLRPLLGRRLSLPDVAFLAWFGPIGVAAIFYAAYASRMAEAEIVWTAGSALVFASAVAHGTTAAPFCRLYAAREGRRSARDAGTMRGSGH